MRIIKTFHTVSLIREPGTRLGAWEMDDPDPPVEGAVVRFIQWPVSEAYPGAITWIVPGSEPYWTPQEQLEGR